MKHKAQMVEERADAVRVAVLVRKDEHHSLLLYREAMLARLPRHGIEVREFGEDGRVPDDCAMVWDPGLGMRPVPDVLFTSRVPVVVTVLGLRAFAVPLEYLTPSDQEAKRERRLVASIRAGWNRLRPRLGGVITISNACAADIVAHLGVPRGKVHPVHLAVDRAVFKPAATLVCPPRDYILHIALGGLSRKNLSRMLAAYASLPPALRIPFLIKLQEEPRDLALPRGVRIVPGHCDATVLADYYRGARCLLFPSIYEGFGLPILEAMSCGCPVITSNTTACAEVAGHAAMLVDPLSVESIAGALKELLCDDARALDLARKGLLRAADFDWDVCAAAHAKVLARIAGQAALQPPPRTGLWDSLRRRIRR